MKEIDKLQIYRGKDIYITKKIAVKQPTLDEIYEYGEKKYFSSIHTLTSTGADLKWQLWDYYQIDYTKISDFDLFVDVISNMLSSRKDLYKIIKQNPNAFKEEFGNFSEEDLEEMLNNPLGLVLNIDFADFEKCQTENKDVVLYNKKDDITIDRLVYNRIVDTVRFIHGLKRNSEMPANERTKMDLIDDARDDALAQKNKEYESVLLPLISTLKVKSGQVGNDAIWNEKIGTFLYDIKRMFKIQDGIMLLQGAYSGFASLKDVDNERINWAGDI